jgi:hypothetical protein
LKHGARFAPFVFRRYFFIVIKPTDHPSKSYD